MTDCTNPNELWTEEERQFYKGLNDEERIAYTCITLLVAVLLCALLSGCTTTKYVPVTEYHTDTLLVVKVQHDSLVLKDSVYIHDKGDTVLIEKWHTQYRDRWRTDTVYQSKRDSIPYPVEVIKEVPAKLTWWQQTRLHLANILLWLLLLLAVIYVGKKHLARLGQ